MSQYYDDIKNYVESVLNAPDMTQAGRAAAINAAADQYGVSREDIAAATGYNLADVNAYLGAPTASASSGATAAASNAPPTNYVTNNGPATSGVTAAAPTANAAAAPTANTAATSAPSLTPAQAVDMIYRSQTTGVPTAEFNKFGGYDAVMSLAKTSGKDLGAPSADAVAAYGQQIADQGYGNMSYAPGATQGYYAEATKPSNGYQAATAAGGVGADQYYKNIANFVTEVMNRQGITDAERAQIMNEAATQYGVSNADIAKAVGVTVNEVYQFLDVNSKAGLKTTSAAASTAASTTGDVSATNAYFKANPDVAAEFAKNSMGMTADQFAQAHWDKYGKNEGRTAPTGQASISGAVNNYVNTAGYKTASTKLGDTTNAYMTRLKAAYDKDQKGDATAGKDYSTLYGELSSKGLSDTEIAALFSGAINSEMPMQNIVDFGQKYTINQLNTKLDDQNKTISGLNTSITDLSGVIEKLKSQGTTSNSDGQVSTTNASTSTNNSNTDEAASQKYGNYLYYGNYNGGQPAAGVSYLTNGNASTTGNGADIQGWGLSGVGMSNYGKARRAADGSQRDVYFTPKKYNKSNNLQGAGWGASYMPF